jgi:hypothetical protein
MMLVVLSGGMKPAMTGSSASFLNSEHEKNNITDFHPFMPGHHGNGTEICPTEGAPAHTVVCRYYGYKDVETV